MINFAPHDLSMVKVEPAIVFNDRVKPLKLPKNKGLFKSQNLNYNLVVSGWGSPTYLLIENHPTVLMTVQLPVIPNKVCVESINHFLHNFKLHDSQMCTRPADGRLSACIVRIFFPCKILLLHINVNLEKRNVHRFR
jgi:hypothetical protein